MLEVYCLVLVSINTLLKSLQTTLMLPHCTSAQLAASFLVCFLIYIEYNFTSLYIVEFQKAHESSEK